MRREIWACPPRLRRGGRRPSGLGPSGLGRRRGGADWPRDARPPCGPPHASEPVTTTPETCPSPARGSGSRHGPWSGASAPPSSPPAPRELDPGAQDREAGRRAGMDCPALERGPLERGPSRGDEGGCAAGSALASPLARSVRAAASRGRRCGDRRRAAHGPDPGGPRRQGTQRVARQVQRRATRPHHGARLRGTGDARAPVHALDASRARPRGPVARHRSIDLASSRGW